MTEKRSDKHDAPSSIPNHGGGSESELEIVIAVSAGICFGVRKAIELAEVVRHPILGPLVHNPFTIRQLAARGIGILDQYATPTQLAERGVTEVVITAHGYPKELKAQLTEAGIVYHDATCPVLKHTVHARIPELEKEGYRVILIGNPNHAEVIAARSYGTDVRVVYTDEDVDALSSGEEPVAVICQTTITAARFFDLADRIKRTKHPNLRAIDTRCAPVKNRQMEIVRLAHWADVMLIIGGHNSANTANLAGIAASILPADTVHHLDAADEFKLAWLDGARRVAVTGGTSTPMNQIIETVKRITDLYPGRTHVRRAGDASNEPVVGDDSGKTPVTGEEGDDALSRTI